MSTTITHTPGPWRAGSYQCVTPGKVPDSIAIWPQSAYRERQDTPATPIALVSPLEKSNDIDFANARLMAAAPELLAACKAIMEVPEAVKSLANWGDQALIATRSAIAKAEGGTA